MDLSPPWDLSGFNRDCSPALVLHCLPVVITVKHFDIVKDLEGGKGY